jgi:hypothetical protein
MLEEYPVTSTHASRLSPIFVQTKIWVDERTTKSPGDRVDGLMDSGGPGPRHYGQDIPAPLTTAHRLARGSVGRLIFNQDRRTEIDLDDHAPRLEGPLGGVDDPRCSPLRLE